MEKLFKVLAINPGSTSTKIAVYENEEEIGSSPGRFHGGGVLDGMRIGSRR